MTAVVGIVTAVVAIASVVFVGITVKISHNANVEQRRIALQGQVADRFSAAIDHLGQEDEQTADKLSIRLGGIYALQRLMIDSPDDETAVVHVLSAFVRTHAPRPPGTTTGTAAPSPADVRAAVTVLSSRPHPAAGPLDFSNTLLSLENANLNTAHLQGTDLQSAYLRDAELHGADLSGARLRRAALNLADLGAAHLANADLNSAILNRADLTGADLTGADLRNAYLPEANMAGAVLTGADLRGVNLSAVTNLTATQVATARTDAQTRLPG
ncbi:pentapeptide repeat-containing protein [Actinoplanes sp. NPDC051494]|uniref:pentapeptide repeat-containing protein n=1 Tax=Actinoplanes sp. NPDC051494 TaxID=3363907 RepID=UPI0037B42907